MERPLAIILRPTTIRDIIGQSHVINDDGIISRMVKNQFLTNLIFFGSPGVGKTSLAIALANDLKTDFTIFNASVDKKEKLQKIINQQDLDKKHIVIVDEIHRMNRDKQDILLEFLESGQIILFAATTENPYFVINPAIRSRCNLISLEVINDKEMYQGLKKIIKNLEHKLEIDDEAIKYLAELASGDLRTAINWVEILMKLYREDKITINTIAKIIPDAKSRGSGYGEEFHDLKSALQKSIRGSDVNAALHYWARLMALGDYETLMRRMLIMAYEDIGLANPTIPPRIFHAIQSFRQVGMPEGRIILGLAIVEMALSEKSISAYNAAEMALNDVKNGICPPVPKLLKDTSYKSATKLGSGKGYKYPPNYENSWVEQQYLPNELKDQVYFLPKNSSKYEKKIIEIYNNFTKKNNKL
ncbi:recombination factor protein RarA [Spiroplasma sabaudiense Ar-1343]|uniref:Recombination factor protein RarA n=1 Tax=Spiroplasma sabaudiense Ar-1343 TaxID=1276257 RepID=W6A9C5_9MOLU|nr:replication-associated recombination protein A [Spiroplasma sabaudiense]AHI53718.1 recombination factor protein RarA [Spiroplasma sabaudiense Ar-1343]